MEIVISWYHGSSDIKAAAGYCWEEIVCRWPGLVTDEKVNAYDAKLASLNTSLFNFHLTIKLMNSSSLKRNEWGR